MAAPGRFCVTPSQVAQPDGKRTARGAPAAQMITTCWHPLTLPEFLSRAEDNLNDPAVWRRKADYFQIVEPSERSHGDFGNAPYLHICAENIINNHVPIGEGNRNGVFFMLAK